MIYLKSKMNNKYANATAVLCSSFCEKMSKLPQFTYAIHHWCRFYPNVTTLRSGLCCRRSVCLLSVCLSVCLFVCLSVCLSVCRLSVTLVHSTQGIEPFGIFLHRCVRWPSSDLRAKFYGDRPRETLRRGVKRKWGIKIERFRIEGYIS